MILYEIYFCKLYLKTYIRWTSMIHSQHIRFAKVYNA
jgi:hypothetical protein